MAWSGSVWFGGVSWGLVSCGLVSQVRSGTVGLGR
jgi:hypothetical protein